MATASDVINQAAMTAGIIGFSDTLDNEELTFSLDLLNQMLYSWNDQGVDTNVKTLIATDEIPLYPNDLLAVRYNLAAMMMEALNRPINQAVYLRAQELKEKIVAKYLNVNEAEMPGLLKSRSTYNIFAE